MIYNFVNIDDNTFSINGQILDKTFIAKPIGVNAVMVVNIYDNSCPLIPKTNIADVVVDGVTYNDVTQLVNALKDVLYSRTVTGDVNNEQIELNRLNIINLENNKADKDHDHDTRYYTKNEVDELVNTIVKYNDLLGRGEVDGDNLNFYDNSENLSFSVDISSLKSQGTTLAMQGNTLSLLNDKGEVLSSQELEVRQAMYDVYLLEEDIYLDDLYNYTPLQPFAVVRTVSDDFYFVSDINNVEQLEFSRLYLAEINSYFDLNNADIISEKLKAWKLSITELNSIPNTEYDFNFWIKKSIGGDTPIIVSRDANNIIVSGSDAGAFLDLKKETVKTLYESNNDTNALTDAEKTKLNNLENQVVVSQDAKNMIYEGSDGGAKYILTPEEARIIMAQNGDLREFTYVEKNKLDNLVDFKANYLNIKQNEWSRVFTITTPAVTQYERRYIRLSIYSKTGGVFNGVYEVDLWQVLNSGGGITESQYDVRRLTLQEDAFPFDLGVSWIGARGEVMNIYARCPNFYNTYLFAQIEQINSNAFELGEFTVENGSDSTAMTPQYIANNINPLTIPPNTYSVVPEDNTFQNDAGKLYWTDNGIRAVIGGNNTGWVSVGVATANVNSVGLRAKLVNGFLFFSSDNIHLLNPSSGVTIANLPENMRPKSNIMCVALESNTAVLSSWIRSDGRVTLQTNGVGASTVRITGAQYYIYNN